MASTDLSWIVERSVRVAALAIACACGSITAISVATACSSNDTTTPCNTVVAPAEPPPTAAGHAIVEMDTPTTTSTTPRSVYAVSDIHGGYDRLASLLAAHGVIAGIPKSPDAMTWAARDAILIVAGDLIDKGPQPVEVIDALRALETSAPASGGLVIVLLGNHEAEFFADPSNSKASSSDGFNKELAAKSLDCGRLASGADPRGAWLRARPLGARVDRWFYSHAGNTKGRTVAELDTALRDSLRSNTAFSNPEITGTDSILEARGWYDDSSVAESNARALGVAHFVMGHDPNAIGPRGAIAVGQGGLVIRIDCGMSPIVNDSAGALLRVRSEGSEDVVEQLAADGTVSLLFRSPRK